jgi:FdhD protein
MREPRWSGTEPSTRDAGPEPSPSQAGPDPALDLQVRVERVSRLAEGAWGEAEDDPVAVEEPLEIRLEGLPAAITMRTPGHDFELAVAGFCHAEGLLDGADGVARAGTGATSAAPSSRGFNVVSCRHRRASPQARRGRELQRERRRSPAAMCGSTAIDRGPARAAWRRSPAGEP